MPSDDPRGDDPNGDLAAPNDWTGPVVIVTGEIDGLSAPGIERAIRSLGRCPPVGLDLTGVAFADAALLHVLADTGTLVIASSPAVDRLLTVAGSLGSAPAQPSLDGFG